MVLRWEGGAPSDAHEWIDALHDALGDEATFYWVRFYQNQGGWRFDLERHGEAPGPKGWSSYRRADDSSTLRVFTALVERGKPLDPSWSQPTASAPAEVVPISRRVAQPAHTSVPVTPPAPEPLPRSVSAPLLTVVELKETSLETPALDLGTRAELVSVARAVPNPEPLPASISMPPLTFELKETPLETPPFDLETRTEFVPVVLPAPDPERLPPSVARPLTVVERTETPFETPPLDLATTTLPVSIVVPAPNPEPLRSSVSASSPSHRSPPWRPRLPDWRSLRLPRLPRLPLPHWRSFRVPSLRRLHLLDWASVRLPHWRLRAPDWRGLRLRDWPSVPLPAWRSLRAPDWRSLRVRYWRRLRLPDWRSLPVPGWLSLRLVLVYTPAILLFAWWLSRDRLPGSPASSRAPAALSQVAQARLEEPQARPSPAQRPKGAMPTGIAHQPRPRRGEVVDVGAPGVTPPVLVTRAPRPPYPPLALARRLSGTVWLNALVDETGRIVEIALVRTSAPGLGFEDAAMTHVYSRVYRPATKRGVPVRVRLPVMVDFTVPPR